MSVVHLRPGSATGDVRAPPSKSYTHRALVVGHLTRRRYRVRGPLDADDTRATASAVGELGTPVRRAWGFWDVLAPAEGAPRERRARVNCGESGTTLRFISALAALAERPVRVTGAPRLSERPIDELLAALRRLGASCRHVGNEGFPIEIRGPIHAGAVSVDASRSSQFASALLLALPTLDGDSSLTLTGRIVSEPYIDATLAMLAAHHVPFERRGRTFRFHGPHRFEGRGFTVPGDASSAAYLWAAAATGGGKVHVDGVPRGWPQADLAVLDLLRSAGAVVSRSAGGATVSAGRRTPFRVDLTNAPDLYPLAGALAAVTSGTSYLLGAEHVVGKETDRKAETAALARKFGATVRTRPGEMRIEGVSRPRALRVDRFTDHRMIMSAAVGALAAERESILGDATAVRKSFPGFWDVLGTITGGVRSG